MKKIFILASLLLPFSLFAQQPPPPPSHSQTSSQISTQMHLESQEVAVPSAQGEPMEDEVYTFVEVMPEYPGGQDAMMTYLMKNLQYPADALEAKKQGTVYISFVVNKDGRVNEVRVVRGLYPSLDQEAIRVVSRMPNWKPGTQNGKPVRTRFNLPVKFSFK